MTDIWPEGYPKEPFSADEENTIMHRARVERGIRSYVTALRGFAVVDGHDKILYDPQSIGQEGSPQVFVLNKEMLNIELDEIEIALDDPSEPDSDLRIWEAMDRVGALFRNEPIINKSKGE